jgi:putative ATP-dependent endonuclease of OLD family
MKELPVRISRLEIQNYSRLPDVALEVRGDLVLVGPNAAGKTSILKAVQFVLGSSVASLYQTLTVDDLRDPSKQLTITVTFVEFTSDEQALFPDEIIVAPPTPDAMTVRLEAGQVLGTDELNILRYFPNAGHSRQPKREQMAAFGLRYLSALRAGGADGVEGRASALRTLLAELNLGPERATVTNALQVLNDALQNSTELGNLRTALAEHLAAVSPSDYRQSDLKFLSAASADDVLKLMELHVNDTGHFRGLAEQSDGLNASAALAFFNLSGLDLNVLAIDEPELHLHPFSQRAVAELLRSSQSQKLISTHSPWLVQRFEPEQIVAFSSTGQVRQLTGSPISKVDKLLAQWWTSARLEPLTARWVVFVEGNADRIVLEAAAAVHGLSLDRASVSIVELGGAGSFKAAYRLFGPAGFDIDLMGMVDEDHETEWATEMGVAVSLLTSNNIFVCRKDLESEYVAALGVQRTITALVGSGAYTVQNIERSCGAALSALSATDIEDFCRHRRNKVPAAISIAAALTGSDAAAMPAVNSLLNKLKVS